MKCQRDYSLPEIEREGLFDLMGASAGVDIEKEMKYGVSGAFLWYIYHELGALGVKRFCALMSGNYGSQLARYEQKGEGDLVKSLEAAGNIKEGFDPNTCIDQFIADYNMRREKKIVYGVGLDVSKIPPGKKARSLPNGGGWEYVDENTPW